MITIGEQEAAALPEKGVLRDYAYNALDVTGTREVADTLRGLLTPATERTYAFERALQAPALTMMKRGIKVDTDKRQARVASLKRELATTQKAINKLPLMQEKWDGTEIETGFCRVKKDDGKEQRHKWPRGVEDSPEKTCERCGMARVKRAPFNPQSPPQGLHLFHDILGLPPYKNKQRKVSVDEDTLEKYGEKFPQYAPLVELMLGYRGIKKQIGFLTARLSPANRFHQSVNVGAAWTGRISSSKSPFGEGGNLQNIAERNRDIFVADAGYKLFYADLKTAESQVVAYMSGDPEYIRAHLEGDTHTYVARLLWPELPWTGDLKKDKAIAKSLNPDWDTAPGHDWRFQAKRVQHATNIGQTAIGMALTAHISRDKALDARSRYFSAFPFIREYQDYVTAQVHNQEVLRNPLGREVQLFGRPKDPHTFKQGLAFYQQSPVADVINMAIWRVWKHYDVGGSTSPGLLLLIAQVHDAILGLLPVDREAEAVAALEEMMTIPVPIIDRVRGVSRTLTIPVEVATGFNWGKFNDDPKAGPINLQGIKEVA